jgi:uncharacterized phage protein gp47/JayE
MPISMSSIYRTRQDILNTMIAQLVSGIPDVYVGADGVIRLIFDIEAGQFESLYLAEQLLLEDMFVATASYQALVRYGDQYGLPMNQGSQSLGVLLFSGEDGAFIPQGTLAAHDPGNGLDPVYFQTDYDATIPAPGDPVPPVVAVGAATGLTGGYEYVVTFTTAQGETLPSDQSTIVSVVNQKINVTNIPIGGPGTMGRNLYRDKNGANDFRLVSAFANNTTTTFTDSTSDASIAAAAVPPTVDTAHAIPVQARSQEIGIEGNVSVATVTTVSDGPGELTGVTNPSPFTGGQDPEDSEVYRSRLLNFIRNPQTGSVSDIEAWALNVPGVETATVTENDPVAGTVTVRITGPGGSIASPDVIAATQQALDDLDYANITIVVSSFTALPTNVTVDVTAGTGYDLAMVTPSVQQAVANYINALYTGETLKIAGIIDSVFGLAGIADVVVTTPSTNQTTPSNQKRTAATITVT